MRDVWFSGCLSWGKSTLSWAVSAVTKPETKDKTASRMLPAFEGCCLVSRVVLGRVGPALTG
eukprot:10627908-Alexandrium_andersonii.AAC.1